MTDKLERFTTEYISSEDRIRLTTASADTVTVIWLTRRLCDRLVPAMAQWLEKNMPEPAKEAPPVNKVQVKAFNDQVQAVAQQQARVRNQTVAAEPVKVELSEKSWLAFSASLKGQPNQLLITLGSTDDEHQIAIPFHPVHLRQWLDILYQNYLKADWSNDQWPEWAVAQPQDQPTVTRQQIH